MTAPRSWLARLANRSPRNLVEVGLALALPPAPLALAACGRTSSASSPTVEGGSLGFVQVEGHKGLLSSQDVFQLDELETVLLFRGSLLLIKVWKQGPPDVRVPQSDGPCCPSAGVWTSPPTQ